MLRSTILGALLALVIVTVTLSGCSSSTHSGATATGTVTGLVCDPLNDTSRAATAGATVSVDGTKLTAAADATGHFTFNSVPVGLNTLVFQGTDSSRAAAIVVDVESGRTTDVGEVLLRDAGQISGLVTAADSGAPLSGAVITVSELVLTNTASELPHPVRTTVTDAKGSYTVGELPVGDYLDTISKSGFNTVSLTLSVTAGATTVGDAKLTAATGTGTMTGTVSMTGSDGTATPVEGALVELETTGVPPTPPSPTPDTAYNASGKAVILNPSSVRPSTQPSGGIGLYTITDSQGQYTLQGIPPGDYEAIAVRAGLGADEHAVTIATGQTLTQNFTLTLHTPSSGTVTGTVSDAVTNAAIVGATVTAVFAPDPQPLEGPAPTPQSTGYTSAGIVVSPGTFILTTTTDVNGLYTLLLPTTVTVLTVSATGYVSKDVAVTVQPNSTMTVNIALTSQKPGVIQGNVTRGDTGAIVSGATVTAEALAYAVPVTTGVSSSPGAPAIEGQPYTTTTDDKGNYTLDVQTWVNTLVVSATGIGTTTVPIAVGPGDTLTVNVVLGQGTITGKVTDAVSGAVVVGATVRGTRSSPIEPLSEASGTAIIPVIGPEPQTTTDTNGVYTLQADYWVQALEVFATSYQFQSVPVTVVIDGTVTVNVKLQPIVTTPVVISGQVTQAQGGPLPPVPVVGATVCAFPYSNGGPVPLSAGVMPTYILSTTTDDKGNYSLSVSAGSYSMYALYENLRSATVTVNATGATTENFELLSGIVVPQTPG